MGQDRSRDSFQTRGTAFLYPCGKPRSTSGVKWYVGGRCPCHRSRDMGNNNMICEHELVHDKTLIVIAKFGKRWLQEDNTFQELCPDLFVADQFVNPVV